MIDPKKKSQDNGFLALFAINAIKQNLNTCLNQNKTTYKLYDTGYVTEVALKSLGLEKQRILKQNRAGNQEERMKWKKRVCM